MAEYIKFKNWDVMIERKAFRRSISLTVAVDQPIRVRTSAMCPVEKVIDFLNQKEQWLEKHLQNFDKIRDQAPVLNFNDGTQFPFMGRDVKLKKVLTLGQKDFFSIFEDQLLWHVPEGQWARDVDQEKVFLKTQKLFYLAYKRYAITELEARAQFWSQKMNLRFAELKFNQPKSRWGSCSSRGVINLNWKIIVFAPEIIDYVIIHELSHLQHMDHSPRFWNLVSKYSPEYKKIKTDLRKNFYTPKFLDL